MTAYSFYNTVFLCACFALYWVDAPKAMAIAALVGACGFSMAALELQDKRNAKFQAALDRLLEREDPMRDIDDA